MFIQQYFLYVYIKLTAHGVTGAWPLHAVRPAEVENNYKPEPLPITKKMVELCVLEKIYENLTVISRIVL